MKERDVRSKGGNPTLVNQRKSAMLLCYGYNREEYTSSHIYFYIYIYIYKGEKNNDNSIFICVHT